MVNADVDCRRRLLALARCSIIDQWDVEEWWDHLCNHAMVHLVECCNPSSMLLVQPRMCCPVEEHCCDLLNISIPTPSPTIHYMPSGQLIVKECSQKVGITTLVISIISMVSAMSVLLIIALARHVQTEAMNIFLDSIYG
jgi:hypothetical protein